MSANADALTSAAASPYAAWLYWGVLGLLLARWALELFLGWLNRRHVHQHADRVPEPLKDIVDSQTYQKSVAYTLARSRFGAVADTYDTIVLGAVLFSGILPISWNWLLDQFGTSRWSMTGYLLGWGILLSIPRLPLEWYSQFKLEERFGFNTSTVRLWLADHLKALAVSIILGGPLILLLLSVVQWTDENWWLWAWGALLGFQLLMVVIAPILILPLFNKFTPLPDGPLRERLLNLGERTGFLPKSIQVMDGSKRSRHSNAFFTGFGRFRKIVLFDTLMQQLRDEELEAVLAHEIGHYKKKHIPKMLLWSAVSMLIGFYLLAFLAQQEWFYAAFGFNEASMATAFLLFALLSGLFTFWLSPLAHAWSRRYEYQADAYAVAMIPEKNALVCALRKLNEKNLSNLVPHPVYSWFYYSHPTLIEREGAISKLAAKG